ncbi:MAG: translation initiation factor IF-1 [Siphoviridae sp. cttb18]|nr:MAG: translation initiation factor IF-1 [Siphoviridae sp. cttb18]
MKTIGLIKEKLPNNEFIVELEDKRIIRCYVAGKMRMNNIFIMIGDKVSLELPPQSNIGRITYRLK